MTDIHGEVAPGYEPLRDAFAANFAERFEYGASIALVKDGDLVVSLWGGRADEAGSPWERNTLVNIWSTTKGVTAICFAMLASRGLIDYDRPVADYWPEFAAHRKAAVTVAMLLSHQAGLTGFREPATLADLYDAPRAAARLAAAEPFWEPGTQSGYHAISMGLLADELFRRVEGRSLRQFIAEELSAFDISIGLPAARAARGAVMFAPGDLSSAPQARELSAAQIAALANPPLDPAVPNSDDWRAAEIPSANGFAAAEGLARLYGAFIGGRIADEAAVTAATSVRIEGVDAVLGIPARWASGFLVNVMGLYGSTPNSFGHSGWGGSFAFADPERNLAFAYTPNQMGTELAGDPRALALMEGLEKALV
ncbi:serine hydrolase domain-containing protein [Sphingopyxis sp. CCNWLW253]|uniref:serine hydrolase domain-containing protein n=1 Tax=unclassified Sphingopyxis TaxID=2614943 RepID=UPI00301306DC